MGPLALIFHLFNFLAPALVVGALLAALAPWLVRGARARHAWWKQSALNAVAGSVALAAGLALFGNDGKMASYSAMLLLIASSQWFFMRKGSRG